MQAGQASPGAACQSCPGATVCRMFVYRDQTVPTKVGPSDKNEANSISVPMSTSTSPSRPDAASTSSESTCTYQYNIAQEAYHMSLPSASTAHADMGLLTLSPASTIPALHLLHPDTHVILQPEQGLTENEWVLFSGETLSFLTGGALQAPIHSVPHIDRRDVQSRLGLAVPPPLRRSMPLFLRADPDVYLCPVNKDDAACCINQASASTLGIDVQANTPGGKVDDRKTAPLIDTHIAGPPPKVLPFVSSPPPSVVAAVAPSGVLEAISHEAAGMPDEKAGACGHHVALDCNIRNGVENGEYTIM